MRATWLILGVVLVAGGVAYWQVRWGADSPSDAPTPQPAVALERNVPAGGPASTPPARPPQPPEVVAAEARATDWIARIAQARAAEDETLASTHEAALVEQAWDTAAARRYAVERGLELVRGARGQSGLARVRVLDRARRLLSRGVLVDDLFGPDGQPLPARTRLLDTIADLNAEVYTYAPGVEGVSRPFVVPPGAAPVVIVTEQRLPYGHNALLYWNKRGNLNPKRLVAGETLLLPVEELTVHVELDRQRLLLFLGDAFVKEYRVGVGKESTPTPRGRFVVKKKQENPDWTRPQDGKVLLAGDPANELGSVWIHIANEEHPEHYGIHGTNRPETVGSACSQGCVRLTNAEASEIYWWVRGSSNAGPATKVLLN